MEFGAALTSCLQAADTCGVCILNPRVATQAHALADRKGSGSSMSISSCSLHARRNRSSSRLLQAVRHRCSSPAQAAARLQLETGLSRSFMPWTMLTADRTVQSATAACSPSTRTCLQRMCIGCKCVHSSMLLTVNPFQSPRPCRAMMGTEYIPSCTRFRCDSGASCLCRCRFAQTTVVTWLLALQRPSVAASALAT